MKKEVLYSLPLMLLLSLNGMAAQRPILQKGQMTSVDNPAPYRYLDWVPRDEIESLPASQRPLHTGVCPGFYLPPVVTPSSTPGRMIEDVGYPVEAASKKYEMVGKDTIHMEGSVVVQQGHRLMESDELDIDTASKQVELKDNVRIRQEGMLLTGKRANLDLNGKRVAVNEAEYVIHSAHIRGAAEKVSNTSEDVLVLDRSTYTTCEPGADTWYFAADNMTLNKNTGWGTATSTVLRIRDVPLFYIPWIMFPIDDKRHSGILVPTIGTNDSTGLDIAVPYYLNLAPNYDATITPRYLSKRGDAVETEFRYLTENTKGEIGSGYLDHDKLRDDDSRYLAIWHQSSNWKNGWTFLSDYNRVSDPDYFLDLGSDLNASAQTQLNQLAQTNYRTDHWNFTGLVQRYQTLDKVIRDQKPELEPYDRLPDLRADGYGQLGTQGMYWTFASEAVTFQHPHHDIPKPWGADRTSITPGVGYRTENSWGYVNPRVKLVHTEYALRSDVAVDDLTPSFDTFASSVDSGLLLEKRASLFGSRQIQTLEPRLFGLYVPRETEQNAIPLFDTTRYTFSYDDLFRENRFAGGDRYGDAQQISLGLTSRFIEEESGEEWLSMSIGQAYYFRDRYVQVNTTTPPQTTKTSALATRIVWQTGRSWLFYQDTEWDSDVNNIDNITSGFQYNRNNDYLLNLSYFYHDPGAVSATPGEEKLKQTDLSFIMPVAARWSLLTRWGFDEEHERTFDRMVGVEYESCCWRARVVTRRFLEQSEVNLEKVEPRQGIYLQVQLKGFAGVGKQVDNLFSKGIPGYQDREDYRRYRF